MIITRTPLRLSLFGGGTDFRDFYHLHGGAVLSFTIDKYIYIILKERFDDDIVVQWGHGFQRCTSVAEIEHELVREAMKLTHVCDGLEIHTLADVPSEGTGLGSSSSVTVGILNALYIYKGMQIPAAKIAKQACQIEIDTLGKPIGIQDQFIAAYGGLRFFEFLATDRVKTAALPANGCARQLINNLLCFYTGCTRQSATILTEQKSNIADRIDTLKLMRDKAYQAKSFIEQGNCDAVGNLLDVAWQLKKEMASAISNPDIETMYHKAKTAGALGGKIAGAGGGGFLLLYVPPQHQENVRTALAAHQELHFNLERDGTKTIFNIRR